MNTIRFLQQAQKYKKEYGFSFNTFWVTKNLSHTNNTIKLKTGSFSITNKNSPLNQYQSGTIFEELLFQHYK